MSLIAVPVAIAILLSLLIPAVVRAAVRRGDRSERAVARPGTHTGALFAVENRRWQPILLRVTGIVFLVVGGFLTLVSVVESETMDGPGPLITGAAITVAGALFVVLSLGISRFRVDAFQDHLMIRSWFRPTRKVPLTGIGAVRPSLNRFGGIDVEDVDGRVLFTATTISVGYEDIVAHLQERSTRPVGPSCPPGDVPAWQGTSLRAEWFPVPRGRRGGSQSGVLLTAGGVAGHMRAGELVHLLNHRIGIVDSTGSDPLVFLCWADSASPSSIAWESLKTLPADSLALLADPMDGGAIAVLTGTELTSFSAWITDLPR